MSQNLLKSGSFFYAIPEIKNKHSKASKSKTYLTFLFTEDSLQTDRPTLEQMLFQYFLTLIGRIKFQ